MILAWIERMRQKPKHVRTQVSFAAAAVFTGFVALIWGVTLPLRLNTFDQVPAELAAEEDTQGFFEGAQENFAQVLGAFRGEVDAPENTGAVSETGTYRAGAPAPDNQGAFETYYGSDEGASVVVPEANERRVIIGTTTAR